MTEGAKAGRAWAACAMTSLALIACGGGGGDSAPVPPAPPPPAPAPATPPTITTQPQTQSVDAGATATISVLSSNATSYQWQASNDGGASWTDVAGATSNSLAVSPGLIDSGRQFRVMLANSVGSTVSSPASLTVRAYLRLLAGALGGPGYVDSQGATARFDFPRGVATDAAGNIYSADTGNHVIRRTTPGGAVTTFAGTPGVAGRVDGPASGAQLSSPRGLAIDRAGVLWFIDQGTCYLRKIAGGAVISVARIVASQADGCYLESSSNSRGSDPAEIAISAAGDVFVSDRAKNVIHRVDTLGTVALYAGNPDGFGGAQDGDRLGATFRLPRGLAFDATGNLYVADSGNGTIRRIDAVGNVTTIAGQADVRTHLDGVGLAARFVTPVGLALVAPSTMAIVDAGSPTVRLIDLASMGVTTIAGDPQRTGAVDGQGNAARFNTPFGVSGDDSGEIVVSDSGNAALRRVTRTGAVTTIAGQALPAGILDGSGAAARFNGTHSIVADASGNIYVADAVSHVIRKVTPTGTVTTLAGAAGQFGLVDGTGSSARFNYPTGLAIDAAGNLIVADYSNSAIRRVTPNGVVTTIAGGSGIGSNDGPALMARFDGPGAVSVDSAGSIFIAETYSCRIRRLSTAAVVTTFASKGMFGDCMALDGATGVGGVGYVELLVAKGIDDVLFTELTNGSDGVRLRRARADGSIRTVAGGANGYADGQGTAALFRQISGLSADRVGNIYISDGGNNAVRLMRPDYSVITLIGRRSPANTTTGTAPVIRNPHGIAVLPGNAIAISSEAAILLD